MREYCKDSVFLVIIIIFMCYRCLEKNPEHRPFSAELEEHPFLQSVPENDFHVRHFQNNLISQDCI